jgi:hypothetical protein
LIIGHISEDETMTIRAFADGLWVVDAPLRALGLELGTRMSIARLPDGGLLLHSPVPLARGLREQVDALGPVRAVVFPNKLHHLFGAETLAAWPEAISYAAPGLREKDTSLRVDHELRDEAPPTWGGVFDLQLVHGASSINEVVMFHRPSGSVLFTDLAFNLRPGPGLWRRLYLRLNRAGSDLTVMKLMRLAIRDRTAAQESLDAVLKWPIERVIVCHGEVIGSDGGDAVRRAFADVA